MNFSYTELIIVVFIAILVAYALAVFLIAYFNFVYAFWKSGRHEITERDFVEEAGDLYKRTYLGKVHFYVLVAVFGAVCVTGFYLALIMKFSG